MVIDAPTSSFCHVVAVVTLRGTSPASGGNPAAPPPGIPLRSLRSASPFAERKGTKVTTRVRPYGSVRNTHHSGETRIVWGRLPRFCGGLAAGGMFLVSGFCSRIKLSGSLQSTSGAGFSIVFVLCERRLSWQKAASGARRQTLRARRGGHRAKAGATPRLTLRARRGSHRVKAGATTRRRSSH